jgi:alanine dehydrogenase
MWIIPGNLDSSGIIHLIEQERHMIIGVPKEIKPEERRVAVTPEGVARLVGHGHKVIIEHNAGAGSGIGDASFKEAGALIQRDVREVWRRADMILKVKEPLEPEFALARPGQIVFTFFHLAADRHLTVSLLRTRIVGIAYETVQLADGSLPILRSMSEIAGYLSVQLAARGLEAINGGRGVVMGGIPGLAPARVTIVGGGSTGVRAAEAAAGMGAQVTILEINRKRIGELREMLGDRVHVKPPAARDVEHDVTHADVVIGALLSPGARASKVVTRAMVKKMQPGAVIVDVAVDQGGCCETIRPTTHDKPFYVLDGVVHCGITNMPSAVPRSSTLALTKESLPFVLEIADKGYRAAARENPAIMKGIDLLEGKLTNPAVARAFGMASHEFKGTSR